MNTGRSARRRRAEELVAEALQYDDPHLVMSPSDVRYFAGVDRRGVPIYVERSLSAGRVYVMDGEKFRRFMGGSWLQDNTKARRNDRADVSGESSPSDSTPV